LPYWAGVYGSESAYGCEQVFDFGNVALVGDDNLLLPLRELPHIQRFLGLGQSRELTFQIDDLVINGKSVFFEEQFRFRFGTMIRPVFIPAVASHHDEESVVV